MFKLFFFFLLSLECLILFPPRTFAPLPTRQVGEKCYVHLLESSNTMSRDAMMMMMMMMMPVVLGKRQEGNTV